MSFLMPPSGIKPPEDIYVVVEISGNEVSAKYEMDKDSGFLFVDRFLSTAMHYPCHYGFIPHTLGGDGDPLDVLVVADTPVVAGCVIRARPVGMLVMDDENGEDEKIIAVPHEKLTACYKDVRSYRDLSAFLLEKIQHFFTCYKNLEKEKFVNIHGWKEKEEAHALIVKSIKQEHK